MSQAAEAKPYPAGPTGPGDVRRRAVVVLGGATLIAVTVALGIFYLVLKADFLTAPAQLVSDLMFKYSAFAVLAAVSPLFASLLVGYGYMRRAMRRRAAEQKQALAQAARQSLEEPAS